MTTKMWVGKHVLLRCAEREIPRLLGLFQTAARRCPGGTAVTALIQHAPASRPWHAEADPPRRQAGGELGGAGAGGSSETPECASASNAELISALLTDVARAPGKLMTESERRRAEPPHDLKQERKNPKLRDDDGNLIHRPQ